MSEVDWRNLPPVPEGERPVIDEGWGPSQTFLKLHDRCDRAAMLHLQYEAGAGSVEMNRGMIFHEVVARLTQYAIEKGENRVPAEWGKDELLAFYDENPEVQVSARERDALRYMVAHWCAYEYLDPAKILCVESAFRLDVGDFTVGGHPDRVDDRGGGELEVIDYKTGFPPDREEFTPQAYAPDGRPYFAGDFQTMLYACGLAFGTLDDGMTLAGYDRYRLTFVYPRRVANGDLIRRPVLVTQPQLLDFMLDVEHQLRRLRDVNLGEGRWQPTPGTVCRECPAEYACPLPMLLRPESQHADLQTREQIEKAATSVSFMAKRTSNLKARVKKAAERLPPEELDLGNGDEGVRCGTDEAFVFLPYDRESISDKVGYEAAVDAAVNYGTPFDRADFTRRSTGTEFEKRKVAREK